MTEQSIKEREHIFEQFDQSIKKLGEEKDYFLKGCVTAIEDEKKPIKIYGLAFNFAWTLRYVIDCAAHYKEAIQNSLLDDRSKLNNEKKEIADEIILIVKARIKKLDSSLIIDPDDVEKIEREHYQNIIGKEEENTTMTSYLTDFSKDLAHNGHHILSLVTYYLNKLEGLMAEIVNVRANFTPANYGVLYHRELAEFKMSEQWEDYKNSFIEKTVQVKYHGVAPKVDDLWGMYEDAYGKIENLHEYLGTLESYLGDDQKLGTQMAGKYVNLTTATKVLEFFRIICKMELIKEWVADLENGETCYDPLSDNHDELSDELQLVKITEDRLKVLWPEILEVMKDAKAVDWVCFYHVLVFYTYINNVDFIVFNKWLSGFVGKEIITYENARKIKTGVWAMNANKKWSLDMFPKNARTKNRENTFIRYVNLCDELKSIIQRG